jgi:hypothetical protein
MLRPTELFNSLLDPGEYAIGAYMSFDTSYSTVTVNGVPFDENPIRLAAGENVVRITKRYDYGKIDAPIDPETNDGTTARNAHQRSVLGAESVLLLDERGVRREQSVGVVDGRLKGNLPPGHYVAVIGTNWIWSDPRWNDPRLLKAVARPGTPFVIRPHTTTRVPLTDRTVEIQNLTAELRLPMWRR